MDHAVLIAGLGRCGTTLLFDTLVNKLNFGGFIVDISNDTLAKEYDTLGQNDLAKFWYDYPRIQWKSGHVYKTHDFAPKNLQNIKVVFLFGDPRNIVLSAHNVSPEEFILPLHYKHMHADFSKRSKYLIKDVLRLEENFDSWYKSQNFPLITVRYEKLYKNVDMLEAFLNQSLQLPPYKERRFSWEALTATSSFGKHLICKTYQSLITKINNAEDIKIW
jgi:hypothetical protein